LGKKRNKMKEQNATPKLYIGIDIHKRSWAVYTATDLFWGKQSTCKPDPGELKQWVDKHFADHEVHCAYEAGGCGYSTYRAFVPAEGGAGGQSGGCKPTIANVAFPENSK
jgi:hypothetical protein